MIVVEQSSVVTAVKEAFFAVLAAEPNTSDPSILHEDAAVIRVTPTADIPPGFIIRDNTFHYQGTYSDYFPEVDADLVGEEERDYTKLFLSNNAVRDMTQAIIKDTDSRRCLATSWDKRYLNPQVVGVCITQLYARMHNGKLELHSHARANDAYRLLLLDMQLALCIQRAIATAAEVPTGDYIHFVDSLHMYSKYESPIHTQSRYMQQHQLWQS